MSIIKSPFKRKTTPAPQSPKPKIKTRPRSASEGDRSQNMGSLSVINSSNLSIGVVDVCPKNEPNLCENNEYLKNEQDDDINNKLNEINNKQINIYAELDLTSIETKKLKEEHFEISKSLEENLPQQSKKILTRFDNIQSKSNYEIQIKSIDEKVKVENPSSISENKIENFPPKCESFLFKNKNSTNCTETVKCSIDVNLDKIDEINKVLDDQLKQTLPKDSKKLEKYLDVTLKKQEDEILQCENITTMEQNNTTDLKTETTTSPKNSENDLDIELQQLIQRNFIKPTPKQILQEQKEVEMLAEKLRKKAEIKEKKELKKKEKAKKIRNKRSSSFSHRSINNLITNLKELSFSKNHSSIEENISNSESSNENQNIKKKLKHSSSERIPSSSSLVSEKMKIEESDKETVEKKELRKGIKDRKLNRTPKKSPKSPKLSKGKKIKDHMMRNTFRMKLFHFQMMRKPKICEKCSKKIQYRNKIHPTKSINDFEKEIDFESDQQNPNSNKFCICNETNMDLDFNSNNDELLCVKEHTYCEPFGVSNTFLGFICLHTKIELINI